MRRLVKITKWIILSALAIITIYYTAVGLNARRYTKQITATDLQSYSWRPLDGQIHKFMLDLDDMSKRQLDILLKVQDPSFFSHNGVDFKTPGAGITTLTEALSKKLLFKQFRPGIAKIKLALISFCALDPIISKRDQLRLFINMVYLGNIGEKQVYGFHEAAQAYYEKYL